MSKKLFSKVFILLLVVGLLFAVAPTGQAQAQEGTQVLEVGTGKTYTTLADAMLAVDPDLAEITYVLYDDQTFTTTGHGTPDLAKGADVVNLIKAPTVTGEVKLTLAGVYHGTLNAIDAQFNVEGLTLINGRDKSGEGTDPWEFAYFEPDSKSVTFKDCKFNHGVMVSIDATFDNCLFSRQPLTFPSDTTDYSLNDYALWIHNFGDVLVKNSTFQNWAYGGIKSTWNMYATGADLSLTLQDNTFVNIGNGGDHTIANLDGAVSVTITGNLVIDSYTGGATTEQAALLEVDPIEPAPTINVSNNIWATPSVVYVDDDWAGLSFGVDPDGTGPAIAFGNDAFATIQQAISATAPGGTVNVAAGTYAELLTVNKSITLQGPNAAVAGDGIRLEEAVITFPDGLTGIGNKLLTVESDGVTVAGLKFQDKEYIQPLFPLHIYTLDANNLVIKNNLFIGGDIPIYRDPYIVGYVYEDNTGWLIEKNKFVGGPFVNSDIARAMYIYKTGATIQNNVIEGYGVGIQILPASAVVGGEVKNNTIAAGHMGLYHNGHDKGAGAWSYSGNTITVAPNDRAANQGVYSPNAVGATVNFNAIRVTNFGLSGTGALPVVTFSNNVANLQPEVSSELADKIAIRLNGTAAAGTTVSFDKDSFVNYTVGIQNGTLSAVDGSPIWWGSIAGPAAGTVVGTAEYAPWCGDAECSFLVYPMLSTGLQASIDVTPAGGTLYVPAGTYTDAVGGVVGGYSTYGYQVGGITLILADGVVIANPDDSCFSITQSHTRILSESIGGAKCVPNGYVTEPTNSYSHGIVIDPFYVNVQDIVIDGLEIDGSETNSGSGIYSMGYVTDIQILNNYMHDLFWGTPSAAINMDAAFAGLVQIQGNLFKDTWGISDLESSIVPAEYNSWGKFTVGQSDVDYFCVPDNPSNPTVPAYCGVTDLVQYVPYTHAAIEVRSTNPTVDNWENQVFVDDEITYEVYGVFQNITAADFTLTYDPTKLEAVSITPVTGIFKSADGDLVDELVDGQIRYDGTTYPGFTSANASGTLLYTVTFTALGAGDAALAIDPATDLFGMIPPSGPSTNVYAAELDSVTVHQIKRPTLTPTNLDGLYVVGVSHEISTVITNPATGGVWTESPAEPDAIGWIRISNAQVADITQLQFKYTDGVWYDFSVQDQYGGQAVQQDNEDVIARFGNYNYGFDMPNDWSDVDAFRVTFAEAGTHTVTIGIYDMMDTAENYYGTDDILLTEITQEITVYDPPTISSDDVDGYYVTGIEQGFTVSLDNPSTGGNFAGVVVDLKITGADLADIASLYYWETELDPDAFALWTLTEDGSGNLIGTYGPAVTGFPMNHSYNVLTPFNVTFAEPGSYPFELQLRDVATGTILDTFTDTAVVYESPTISSADIQGYYLTEEAREFTVSVNNPLSPDGMAYNPTMFKFTIPDVTLADVINTAKYYETYDPAGTWQTLPLRQVGPDVVGWYGLVNYGGFNLPADGLEHPGLLEVNFKAPGEYDVIVELYLMDGTIETGPNYVYEDDTVRLLASKEFTMFAYDQPELTGSSLPWQYYIVGDAQESTTTIINPPTGYPYGDSIVFDITIFDHDVADITNVTCTYFGVPLDVTPLLQDTEDDITARLVGANGFFTVGSSYNESITCTTTFAIAGTYETLAEMVHVVGGVERVVATREATTEVYTKPVIDGSALVGPYQVGVEKTVTIDIDNVDTMFDPNNFYLRFDLPEGMNVSIGTETCEMYMGYCYIYVVLSEGQNSVDLDITFDQLYDGPLTVDLYFTEIDPDRELATYTTPTNVVVYANVASVTGTVSMQGRTTRAGVLYTLAGNFGFGPYTATSINQISNNVSFANLASGLYAITVEQARYLDVTIAHGATIDLATLQAIATLELRAGDANDDNYINPGDASIVGAQYGTGTIADQGDINFDNRVNIQDLALIGGNLDLQSADPSAANYAYGAWIQ